MKNKILRAAASLALVAGATTVQAAGNPAEGKNSFETCVGCHGILGYTNAVPSYHVPLIGGQHVEYVTAALKAYASGARTHASMNGNAVSIGDADIQNLAAFIAAYKGSPKAVPVTGDAAAGKAKAQACAACHGDDGNSQNGNNPRLAGQYESYLVKSLKDYKSGTRKNPVMQGMVAGLSDDDINAIAAFYASQKPVLSIVAP